MQQERVKTDLHNHLGRNGANPGFDETIDIVVKRLGKRGIFGICNDGPEDYRYEEFVEQAGGRYERVDVGEGRAYYVPEKEVLVVGVEEVESTKGHFLVVGIPKRKKIGTKNLEDALKKAEDLNGIMIPVHSFFLEGLGSYLVEKPILLHYFDSLEVYNASAELGNVFPFRFVLGDRANQKALDFYRERIEGKYDIGICSFTDGHSCKVIGTSHTLLPQPRMENSETLVSSLRQGLKETRDPKYLHTKPNKWDAFIHAVHMATGI